MRAVTLDYQTRRLQQRHIPTTMRVPQSRVLASVRTHDASARIYGLVPVRCTPWIGIRVALGSSPAGILMLMLGEGLRLAVAGTASVPRCR